MYIWYLLRGFRRESLDKSKGLYRKRFTLQKKVMDTMNTLNTKALFVSGTGTDIGKTYCTALLAKCLREAGYDVGYYKAAVSGVTFADDGSIQSDATYVAGVASIPETHDEMVSYTYRSAVSPHLAAKLEGNPVEIAQVKKDFEAAGNRHEYVLMEGSGGITCPLRYDETGYLGLDEVVSCLKLPVLLVADAGLGTLNALMTTMAYLEKVNLQAVGVILNRFHGGDVMYEDNRYMTELLCGIPVVACVPEGAQNLKVDPAVLAQLFTEV